MRSEKVKNLDIEVSTARLEVAIGGPMGPGELIICAAHPAGVFGQSVVDLLRNIADASVVCVNPRGIGESSAAPSDPPYTFECMVDDLDAVRHSLGIERWVFWGMSGGGWIGQAYATKYPNALRGLILESVCACFRIRLADPECIASPFHPSWRPALEAHGLIDSDSHTNDGDPLATEWREVEGVGSVFCRRGGAALVVSPMPISAEMRAAMPLFWTADFRTSLPYIRRPTLIIGGGSDPIVPTSHVRFLHDRIAGSRLLIIGGAGHVPTTASFPEVKDSVRSFLTG